MKKNIFVICTCLLYILYGCNNSQRNQELVNSESNNQEVIKNTTHKTDNGKWKLDVSKITKQKYDKLSKNRYELKGKKIDIASLNPKWLDRALKESEYEEFDGQSGYYTEVASCYYYKETKQFNIGFEIGYRWVSYMVSEEGVIDTTLMEGVGSYSKDGIYASVECFDSDFVCSIYFYENVNGKMKQIWHYYNTEIAEEAYGGNGEECVCGFDCQWVGPRDFIFYAISTDSLKPEYYRLKFYK